MRALISKKHCITCVCFLPHVFRVLFFCKFKWNKMQLCIPACPLFEIVFILYDLLIKLFGCGNISCKYYRSNCQTFNQANKELLLCSTTGYNLAAHEQSDTKVTKDYSCEEDQILGVYRFWTVNSAICIYWCQYAVTVGCHFLVWCPHILK